MRTVDWRSYVNADGDFELPSYLYRLISDLMKQSLDMGTLLSNDPAKLRAFKEQTKTIFKKRWLDVAQALEAFDIIVPCGCPSQEYCRECGGSRYRLNAALSPDKLREISVVIGPYENTGLQEKLEEGLRKALSDPDVLRRAIALSTLQ